MDLRSVASIVLTIVGLLIAFFGYRALSIKTYANSMKGSAVPWFGPLVWMASLAAVFTALPKHTSPQTYALLAGAWFIVAYFGYMLYSRSRGAYWRPGSITYVAVLVKFWMCRARAPQSTRSHSTIEMAIGLSEHFMDLNVQADANTSVEKLQERLATEIMTLHPPRFDEDAMVASDGLDGTTTLTLRVMGPAFRVQPDSLSVTANDLVHHPVRVLLFCEHQGSHLVQLEFLDSRGRTRGRFSVPVRVTDKYPLLPDWAGRAAMILGAFVAMAFSLLQIAIKLREFWK